MDTCSTCSHVLIEYLIVSHHCDVSIHMVKPVGSDVVGKVAVQIGDALVGATNGNKSIAKVGVGLKLVSMSRHGAT